MVRIVGNLVPGAAFDGIRTETGMEVNISRVKGLAWVWGISCSVIGGSRYLGTASDEYYPA
jgi:hypothetical protein